MPDQTQPHAAPAPPVGAPPPAHAAPSALPSAKPEISFEDFAKVDLRIAKVVQAEFHPGADRLLRLRVDDGSGTPRQICAGIRGHYQPEQMVGRLIVIVANLAPRKIRGEESQGMLLAASDLPKDAAAPNPDRRVILLRPDVDIAPGSIVS